MTSSRDQSIQALLSYLACVPENIGDQNHPLKAGGASRDRTDDPLLAKQVLSQLSYGPVISLFRDGGSRRTRTSGLTLIRGAL